MRKLVFILAQVGIYKCERIKNKDSEKIAHEHSLEHKLHVAHQEENDTLMGQVRLFPLSVPSERDLLDLTQTNIPCSPNGRPPGPQPNAWA